MSVGEGLVTPSWEQSLRDRPSLLCGSLGGGLSRAQSLWLPLGGLLCPLTFVTTDTSALTPKLWAHAPRARMWS